METIEVTILGNPAPLARPRFMRSTGIVFDPQKKVKEQVREQLDRDMVGESPLLGALHVDLSFHMPIPKSLSKKRQRMWRNSAHSKKPDLDNLIKFSLDVSNGILFEDDSQICSINAFKFYSEEPKTVISIFTYPIEDLSMEKE